MKERSILRALGGAAGIMEPSKSNKYTYCQLVSLTEIRTLVPEVRLLTEIGKNNILRY
jgi:hypothetical protein